jgi:hypothetical protein
MPKAGPFGFASNAPSTTWGAAGLWVVDFTDPTAPVEIGFWAPQYASISYWSHWYNGRIYLGENSYARDIGGLDGGSGDRPATLRVLEMDGLGLDEVRSFKSGFISQWQDTGDLTH